MLIKLTVWTFSAAPILEGGANLQWGKGLGLANGANLTNFCVMKVKFRKF